MKNGGDGEVIATAIKEAFFSKHASGSEDPEYDRTKLAKNSRLVLGPIYSWLETFHSFTLVSEK